jgi:hypothetical protein
MSDVAGLQQVHLRLTPARNGQKSCITLADNFDFEGAIAQLGERLDGIQEAAGSSPASSTFKDRRSVVTGCDDFRIRFSYWVDRVAAGEEVLVTRPAASRESGYAPPPVLSWRSPRTPRTVQR